MAEICGHCKSAETQAVTETVFCLQCGQHTDLQGRPVVWQRKGERHRLLADARSWEVTVPQPAQGEGEWVAEEDAV